jgi:hypothetical protein
MQANADLDSHGAGAKGAGWIHAKCGQYGIVRHEAIRLPPAKNLLL